MNPSPVQFVFAATGFDRRFAGPSVWVVQSGDVDEPTGRQAALRRVLAAHLEVRPESIALSKDVHGRPFIAGESPPVDFSVSHVPGTLAVAVSCAGGRIGVDVESVRDDVDPLLLARDHFTPAEAARLAALAPAERLAGFYRIWTAKEAMAKAIGHGFSFGLDAIETAPGDDPASPGALRIARLGGSERFAAGWRICHRFLPGLLVAVALG